MVFEKHKVGTEEIKTIPEHLMVLYSQVTFWGHPLSHSHYSPWDVITFLSHNSSWKPLPELQIFCSLFSFQATFTLDHFVCIGSVPVLSFVSERSPFSRLLLADASPLVRLNSQKSHIHFPNLHADLYVPLPAGRYLPEMWVTRIVCSFPYGITWA